MNGNTTQILVAMCIYMLAVIGIGVYFAKRANQNSDNYFIGGRSLGPWVAEMCIRDRIKDIQVLETIKRGTSVYKK